MYNKLKNEQMERKHNYRLTMIKGALSRTIQIKPWIFSMGNIMDATWTSRCSSSLGFKSSLFRLQRT
jgi:hypothetical protein